MGFEFSILIPPVKSYKGMSDKHV